MTNTIEALWNGELAFVEHCGAHDDAANALVCEMEQCREGLWPQLGESQREQVQGYLDRMERYTMRMMELAFRDGFCAGMQLLSEGLHGALGTAGGDHRRFCNADAENMHGAGEWGR